MSKLAKFKERVTPTEAAELLTRLISEDVTDRDIEDLLHRGWITGMSSCSAEVVKITPSDHCKHLTPLEHLSIIDMIATDRVGYCDGFDLPSAEVFIEGHGPAYVLKDEKGNLFALRDDEDGRFLSSRPQGTFPFRELKIPVCEIYDLARQANDESSMPVSQYKSKLNTKTFLCDFSLYSVPEISSRTEKKTSVTVIQQPQDAPSFPLVVGVLLGVLKNKIPNMTQASLTSEITDTYKLRGLSERNLGKIFAGGNSALAERRSQNN